MTKMRATSVGFIFQTFNLIPTLSAQENVETALVPLGVSNGSRRARAAEALASVGLGDRLRHLPGELSGGQQQRVAIARALVKEPKVLLADEPTGNLDEDTRDEIIGLLEKLWQEKGLSMVIVTHDSSIARRAQRLGMMKNGKLTIKHEGMRDHARRASSAQEARQLVRVGGGQPAGGEPRRDVPCVPGEERPPVRVRDDVDDLRQVDHHQPAAVHQQVVGRQVPVREPVPGERAQGRDELIPQARQLLPRRPGLGEPGRACAVRVADELEQHLGADDLHRVGDGHLAVYSWHSALNSALAHCPAIISLPYALRLAVARVTRLSLVRRPSR